MKVTKCVLVVLCLLMFSGTALAEDFEYHPMLSDNFNLTLGAFKSDNSFKISAAGISIGDNGDEIDFGNSVGVDENTTVFNSELRWKFGKQKKWSLAAQYFSNNSTGEAVLTKDVGWQDVTFREGTFVGSGVKLAVTRIFVGRSLAKSQQYDFGIGAGLHNLDITVFIEGDIRVNDGSTDFFRGEANKSQPLPNLGAWYHFSPARKWLLHARVDWISASIGDYDGTLWNTSFGVNYQAFRNFGLDLSYQFFNLNLGVNKTDWQGNIDLRYSGPVLSLTTNW